MRINLLNLNILHPILLNLQKILSLIIKMTKTDEWEKRLIGHIK